MIDKLIFSQAFVAAFLVKLLEKGVYRLFNEKNEYFGKNSVSFKRDESCLSCCLLAVENLVL